MPNPSKGNKKSRNISGSHQMSEKRDSNPRPRPWQGRALPTELFSHLFKELFLFCEYKYKAFFSLYKHFVKNNWI